MNTGEGSECEIPKLIGNEMTSLHEAINTHLLAEVDAFKEMQSR